MDEVNTNSDVLLQLPRKYCPGCGGTMHQGMVDGLVLKWICDDPDCGAIAPIES